MYHRNAARALLGLISVAIGGCLMPVGPASGPGPASSNTPSTAASPAVAGSGAPVAAGDSFTAAPRGPSRAVTIRGMVRVAGGGATSGGSVRLVSVTPNNPFDRRVALDGASYEVSDVPTGCQYAAIASVPGQPPKLRVETLLSTAPAVLVRHFGGDAREDLPGSNYTVGVAWCSEDAAETAAARWLSARALMDIPVYQASPLVAATAAPTSPTAAPAATPGVVSASPIAIFTAQPITPCVAHTTRLVSPAGVEETPTQAAPEGGLVGDWQVKIPGAAWSSDAISGSTVVTTTHVGFGAALGELRIAADGAYTWGGVAGKLRQVVPFNDGEPGVAYWLLAGGGGQAHYMAQTGPDAITLYLPGTNLFGAAGTRLR